MIEKIFPKYIFPKNVYSGITLKNAENFPPNGFFISKGDLLTDDEVEYNRQLLSEDLGYSRENVVFQKQVHGDQVNIVKSSTPIFESDGIITNEKGTVLVLSLADCCGILIYDPEKEVIGAIHSGWKGAKNRIVQKGISKMVEEFDSNPRNLKCWITPCAGSQDYEVGYEVAQYFPDNIRQISNDKYLFDLKGSIVKQIVDLGILQDNIEVSEESTISDRRFHSFRRDKKNSGRMAAFIVIKK